MRCRPEIDTAQSFSAAGSRRAIDRRRFLRGTGAAVIALPMMEAMTGPSRSVAADAARDGGPPKRFVAICATLGFHLPYLVPEQTGADYKLTPYLQKLAAHRDRFTVLSGFSHPNQQGNNGHASELTWLTSAMRPGLAGFRNTISIDQLIARQIGLETRFPYLALSTSGRSMSWSAVGVEIPAESSPSRLFTSLFVDGAPAQVQKELRAIRRGRSILDTVGDQVHSLASEISARDRQKLDEYMTAVRDLESRLQVSQGWVTRPKPEVDAKPPQDIADRNDAIARQRLMYDVIALALQSDSTRTITFQMGGLNAVPKIPGVVSDWHGLSHHGKDPAKIEELRIIEESEFAAFGDFLTKLRRIDENGTSLLDRTSVLFGSNLGNASSHSAQNVPLVLAGGGFRHGTHVAHDTGDNTPLANLFVQLARGLNLEMDRFGTSTATDVAGLELS
jgi:hypothetical protein